MAAEEEAAPQEEAPVADIETLDAFLRSYAQEQGAPPDMPTRVVTAEVPRSALVLAYLTGPYWCGSGGCNLLVLRPFGGTFEVISSISIVRLPVRALSTDSNNLPNLGVRVAGGGTTEGYEALLAYNGDSYPTNPSVPPARRVDDAEGVVLIAEDDEGRRLFGDVSD